ncbi:MAG: sulfite reductase, assimilatory-type [Deltaproteobacteria bacterium]|nr:MAG: sulfite reductase, assimilatory-type [Deltaproteobacteria bacterium]
MKDSKVSLVVPGSPLGMTTPERLEAVAAIAKKYHVETIKITAAQRLKLYGIDAADAKAAITELGGSLPQPLGVKKGAHSVQSCPGTWGCKFARQNSLELSKKVTEALSDHVFPGKVKIGISGCGFNCCEGYVRDVGIFGKKNGWTLIFGGNAGGRPRIGDVIAEDLSDDALIAWVTRVMTFYTNHAKKRERSAGVMNRLGLEALRTYLDEAAEGTRLSTVKK